MGNHTKEYHRAQFFRRITSAQVQLSAAKDYLKEWADNMIIPQQKTLDHIDAELDDAEGMIKMMRSILTEF